jgi:DNA-directed RNA polymerase subunit beta'
LWNHEWHLDKSDFESEEEIVKLSERIIGRFAADDIMNPNNTKEFIVKANEEITEDVSKKLEQCEVVKIKVRSVLTCESRNGICAKCYGRNLAVGKMVELGEAVGIIAAQSIGEPGTQLTMRTFHIGGTASQTYRTPQIISKNSGTIRYNDIRLWHLKTVILWCLIKMEVFQLFLMKEKNWKHIR